MKYTYTFDEYDLLLSENIVFIDLFDSAANNVVLECIVRNTPIIVNKTPGVLEYLGNEYPLYFESLSDVPGLLTTDKIISAYNYLLRLDKEKFTLDRFIKTFMKTIHYQ